MAGFPEFFHVNAGNPVLKHPIYLKYNTIDMESINSTDVKNDLKAIMMTNDNGAIVWYLCWLIDVGKRLA